MEPGPTYERNHHRNDDKGRFNPVLWLVCGETNQLIQTTQSSPRMDTWEPGAILNDVVYEVIKAKFQ